MTPSNEAIEAAKATGWTTQIGYQDALVEDSKRNMMDLERALKAAYAIDFAALHQENERLKVDADCDRQQIESLAEVERLKNEKFYWNCQTHGKSQNAWGCPECVRELREELAEANELLKRFDSYFAIHQETVHRDTEAYFSRRKEVARPGE